MKHGKKIQKLGRPAASRAALLSALAMALFKHERINTTLPKARGLRPYAERMVTHAKRGTLHARRTVLKLIRDRETIAKLFDVIGPRYKERNGGYTRILKTGSRLGDNAPTAIIELV